MKPNDNAAVKLMIIHWQRISWLTAELAKQKEGRDQLDNRLEGDMVSGSCYYERGVLSNC